MGTLYIVATPIGNLEDMSPRAVATLNKVDVIACEDTRHTLRLLNHFGIHKPLTSYHEFNEEEKADTLAARIEAGTNVALVTDAGTPAISDPGYRLVRTCRQRGIPIVSIPGPSAIVAALAAAGLPSNEFMFVGFLPSKCGARRKKLSELLNMDCTLVFCEAPHRIDAMLTDVQDVLGDRETCVAREMTKIHEEYVFGKVSEVRPRVKAMGELMIVVGGGSPKAVLEKPATREDVLRILGMSRDELYNLFFKK